MFRSNIRRMEVKMKNSFKRLAALLLALIMVAGSFVSAFGSTLDISARDGESARRAHVYTDEEFAALDQDVFSMIGNLEVVAQADKTAAYGAGSYLTEEDYAALVPSVIEAIEASGTYVEGTLQQNGNFLVWMTTSGIPCCYDPRIEAELHKPAKYTYDEIMAFEADAERWGAELGSAISASTSAAGHSPTSTSIGLIQPYWESSSSYADSSFTSYSPYYKTMWQNLYGATGGTGVRYSMTNATVDNVAKAIQQCGLVIMDSHGTTDYSGSSGDYTSRANSSYLCLTTSSGITSADTQAKSGTYGTYYDCLKGSGYAYVNGQCIANHMTANAPGSLLYMGICLGMATDKMFTALRAKGVEVVYGYSQSVTFTGEKSYMQSILGYVKNGDTFASALSKTKSSLGSWDPAYSSYSQSQAVRNKVAFPIAVSSEDTYPGQGNVDAVQTVYSTWALFGSSEPSSYTLTATSNNTSYGTVSVSGYTITASPKTGYYVSGYTVTSGSATVTQNGNTFTVTPSSDCTVCINFAAKTTVSVTCVANGSTYQTLSCYSGETVTLPSSAAAVSGWTFAGWASSEVAQTSSKPSYYAPGQTVTVNSNFTVYAVYTQTTSSGGTETVYELVTSTPSSWAGDYVITSDASASYVVKGLSGNRVSYETASNGGAAAFSSTGMTRSGTTLSNVSDQYVFTAAASGSYFSFRNKSTKTYLASYRSVLYTYTSLSTSYCRWTPTFSGSAVMMKNSASSSYPYMGYSSSVFQLLSSSSSRVYLWKATTGASSATVYTTAPSSGSTQPTDPDPEVPVTTYTVSFSVPSGVSAVASQTVEAGNSVTLPTAGAPSGYTFTGWVTGTVNNATSRPSSVLTGSYTPTANVTLNALYSHTTSGGATVYELVTSTPSSWAGNYVVTYGNGSSLYALKGLSGTTKYESASSGGAVALASTGMSLSGATLSNVSSSYVFTMAASGSYYTMKNASTGTYLASRSNYLYSYPSASTSYCRWTPAMNGATVNLKNTASSRYPYLSFSSSGYFMVNSTSGNSIYLWKEAAGGSSTVYTTVIN